MSGYFYFKKYIFVVLSLLFSINAVANTTILSINTDNKTPEEIGYQLGIAIKKKFPKIEAQYDSYLNFLLAQSIFNHLNQQAHLLKASLKKQDLAEINALATTLNLEDKDRLGDGQLSKNEFWLLQFLSDLTNVNKGTAVSIFDETQNSPIIARNLDWKNNPDLRALQAITVYSSADNTLVNIGFAGILGVINGFNDQGLFIASIDSSSQFSTTKVLTHQQSTAFTLKEVLRQNGAVEMAYHFLNGHNYPRHQQILLADKNKSFVIEQIKNKDEKTLRNTESELNNAMSVLENSQHLLMISCFVLKTSPQNCYSSADYYRWNRLKYLLDYNEAKTPLIAKLSTIMQDDKNKHLAVFNHNTLQSIIFTPLNQTLAIYTRSTSNTIDSKNTFQKLELIKNRPSQTPLLKILLFIIGGSILIASLGYIFFYKSSNK